MRANKARWNARMDFEYIDRVPVLLGVFVRYFLSVFGIGYDEYMKDAKTQYYWQLQFAKWAAENIPDDHFQNPEIAVYPCFENVLDASAFGARIVWSDHQPPRALPIISDIQDVERLKIPHPTAGLWGKRLKWWQQMKELTKETALYLNKKLIPVKVGPLSTDCYGPHMIACDLVGDKFYWWMLEYPKVCHQLLDKITNGMIEAEKYFRKIDPTPREAFAIAEDSVQIMSSDMFREFCVPYDNRLYDAFGKGLKDGRGMHMCGQSTHLHEALLNDARITSFNLFGSPVKPEVAAKNLGGRMYLWGNIDPMLMLNGPKEKIREVAMNCLRDLGPCGGFVLADGANICPGTPLENMTVLREAAGGYALQAINEEDRSTSDRN